MVTAKCLAVLYLPITLPASTPIGPAPASRPARPVLPPVRGPDPGGGDHAAVPDHDHFPQAELVPHHVHDVGEGAGVAGVAGEHPDRDRPSLGVGEQPVLDLQPAFLAVPGV